MYFWDQHKTINLYYEMLTASTCDKYNLKKMEYDILMFLYHNPEYNTAADIVRIRKSTKSHVSTALKGSMFKINLRMICFRVSHKMR